MYMLGMIQKLYPINSETADMIALKLATLRQYVSLGIIEAVYIGRKRAIPASVIERITTEGLVIPKKSKTGKKK
jgi:hypothetical protein